MGVGSFSDIYYSYSWLPWKRVVYFQEVQWSLLAILATWQEDAVITTGDIYLKCVGSIITSLHDLRPCRDLRSSHINGWVWQLTPDTNLIYTRICYHCMFTEAIMKDQTYAHTFIVYFLVSFAQKMHLLRRFLSLGWDSQWKVICLCCNMIIVVKMQRLFQICLSFSLNNLILLILLQ